MGGSKNLVNGYEILLLIYEWSPQCLVSVMTCLSVPPKF